MEERFDKYYATDVFNRKVMKEMLEAEVYDRFLKTIDEGKELDFDVASKVAEAMKDWATKKGATHFTHWFQPMTGITAEKHDGFINLKNDGMVIAEFSGKELIKGEPDASSFPSGGLRSTFEARGYTAWDPTSYAFLKGKTLCIPTAFCSFTGEALDKKTPLLRSMDAINKQALRVLKLLKIDAKKVMPMVGPEQEYFLIDKELFKKRKDLLLCGRTLFGSYSPKGQQLDDHYFGTIKPRVQEFMDELNSTLWKLGVPVKTEHNEVAPSQHELAPIYESCNIATDHNQLTMEIIQKIAEKHNLVCLLHEKPFAGVNGSGKHNNWSLMTDKGVNLFSVGKTKEERLRFYLFLTAVIKAVDKYQDLIRISIATASNDYRLGAHEAPPAIVSVFLGKELSEKLQKIEVDTFFKENVKSVLHFGAMSIPGVTKDDTDRNRTSPFAFTGNKFELRMLGSSNSIACANIMLNSAVASVLSEFADVLDKDASIEAIISLIRREIRKHKRILFNGNGYGQEWVEESAKRGLLNLKTTPECLPLLVNKKNVDMLVKMGVFNKTELQARYSIQLENYCESMLIEARTMVQMVNEDYLPVISKYSKEISNCIVTKRNALSDVNTDYEESILKKLTACEKGAFEKTIELDKFIEKSFELELQEKALFIKDNIISLMKEIRSYIDSAEQICPENIWPYPGYSKLLFSIF